MKRFMLLICAAALFALSGQAQAGVVFEDTFDQYANMAEFGATWNADGAPEYQLDTSFGNSGHSVRLVSPTNYNAGGTTDRYYHNLGAAVSGSDQAPLVFSFDLYLHPDGAATDWDGAYHIADIRGYSGGAYKQGDLQNLVGMGLCGSGSYYHARVYGNGQPYGGGNSGYLTLNVTGAPERSAGWHHFESRITSSRVDFYIDGIRSSAARIALPGGVSSVEIGFGYPANGHVMWLDNIRLEVLPEPGSLLLLATAAALALRRRSR